MEYTHLGRSGLLVSRLCLGTMNFGPQTTEPDSHAIMDKAHEYGINYFDTANVYGRQVSLGKTEEIIGNWIAQGGDRREKTVLATKLNGDMGDGWPNYSHLSALNIRRSIDASLKRLQTDYIDIIQFHHVDRDTPWDEIWTAIEAAISQGKIIYAGSSNFGGHHIASAQAAAAKRNFQGFISEQSIYNLIVRDIELEVVPSAIENGLGIIPWSPLQGGLLGGIIKKTNEGVRRLEGRSKESLETHREALTQYEDLAEQLGVEPSVLGLAWLLHRPGVTAPIIGPRTSEQLDQNVTALDLKLDAATMAKLDEIFPGHKEAPEDYAW